MNRSAIFTTAWKFYRIARPGIYAGGDVGEVRVFLPELFHKMLVRAWADAKREAATARQFVDLAHKANVAKVAALPAGERSARLSAIRDELTLLDYAPFGVRTGNRRADLRAEASILIEANP